MSLTTVPVASTVRSAASRPHLTYSMPSFRAVLLALVLLGAAVLAVAQTAWPVAAVVFAGLVRQVVLTGRSSVQRLS